MSDDLVDFLRARLDEDERIAQAASGNSPWRAGVRSGLDVVEGDGWTVCQADEAEAAHIARHDPARILAEVDAKQKLVALHSKTRTWVDGSAGATAGYAGAVAADMLHLLALPYADHPDYRDEWRPSYAASTSSARTASAHSTSSS